MTPLEVTVKTLAEHRWIRDGPQLGVCLCETYSGEVAPYPHDPDAHAAHQAGMLAAAGVVPTVQEWAVDGYAGIGRWGSPDRDDVAEIAEAVKGTVVTRWATAWAPA